MEGIVSDEEFELYLKSSKKLSIEQSAIEDSINTQVDNAIADFQLHFKDLKEKLAKMYNTLNIIHESLKENN